MSQRPGPASGDIADAGLAAAGLARIGWAERSMPVLRGITGRFAGQRPLAGLRVAACLHVTAETAVLVGALRAGGAEVFLAASNPLSTQDDIAAALQASGAAVVFAGPAPTGRPTPGTSSKPWTPGRTWSPTTAATWSRPCTNSGPTCSARSPGVSSQPRRA